MDSKCKRSSGFASLLPLVLLACMPHAEAGPVSISYELTALAAPDRYEVRYTVANLALPTPVSWFSIDFDVAQYDESTLQITSSVPGWSELILGSVLGTPAQYDAYQHAGTPIGIGDSLAGFAVQFTWLGSGRPGSQAFTVYDPGTLDVLDSGRTTAAGDPPTPVPEPGTASLALLAVAGGLALGRRGVLARRGAPGSHGAPGRSALHFA